MPTKMPELSQTPVHVALKRFLLLIRLSSGSRPLPFSAVGTRPATQLTRPLGALLVPLALFVMAGIGLLANDSSRAAPTSPGAGTDPASAAFFDTVVAPLLSRHCLECHDTVARKGRVDLSRQEGAFESKRGAAFIVPGDPENSLVWQAVVDDEMPEDRPPLSPLEKESLRLWILHGAHWHGADIDPLAHERDRRAASRWVPRLTRREYVATVAAATGVDIASETFRLLPPDTRADGFTNTAYGQVVDLSHVEAFAQLAAKVAGELELGSFYRDRVGYEGPIGVEEKELRAMVRAAGRWLLRAPLEDREEEAFLGVASAALEAGDTAEEAHRLVLEAMLQAPRFLYRFERQRGEGGIGEPSGPELATRISYILWGAPPDRELSRAADAGELADPAKAAAQVARMLEDPRALEQSTRFVEEWLHLERLDYLSPEPSRFPAWNADLASDMREETRAFFQEVAWRQDRPLADLLNAQITFVSPRLAEHYGLDLAAKPDAKGGITELTESSGESREPKGGGAPAAKEIPQRSGEGLLALYLFDEGSGGTVRDRSGAGEPLDLVLEGGEIGKGAKWSGDGLVLDGRARLATPEAPRRLLDALSESGALSLEVWVTPKDTRQSGPARIATLSRDTGARNFTLGQAEDRYDWRLRTTGTDGNGLPGFPAPSGSVDPGRPVQLVYSREAGGAARLFVDGRLLEERQVAGDFSNWDRGFRLAFGNELSGDRPWHGTFHLAALYRRALGAEEVARHHAAGPRLDGFVPAAAAGKVAAAGETGGGPTAGGDIRAPRPGSEGLEALYLFDEGGGDRVRDRSERGEAIDLRIDNPDAATWREGGGLSLDPKALLATEAAPARFLEAVRRSGAFTVEALVTLPAEAPKELGRIVSLSQGSGSRNFTLGHDRSGVEFRLRAEKTSGNGIPAMKPDFEPAGGATVHLVYMREPNGRARFYVDGRQRADGVVPGDFGNWDESFRLVLGNETSRDRPWTGTFHHVALWSRALFLDEILGRSQDVVPVDLSEVPNRGGLLTQGSLLTVGGDEASMVARGLFVLHDLLSSGVASAPPGVDVEPVHASGGMSRRAIAETRLADRTCSSCHAKFEPLAFGLEKFDGIGAFSETDEHGNLQREDGEIHFPGDEEPVRYETVGDLMDLLAKHERVRWNFTRKVAQFALGRPLVSSDDPVLEEVHRAALDAGGTYRSLITSLVMSELVRRTRYESESDTGLGGAR